MRALSFFVIATSLVAGPAWADEPADVDETIAIRAADQPTRFLPDAVAAEVGAARAAGVGWGGYDGPTQAPLAGAFAEARIGSRFAIGAGATWAPGNDIEPGAVRPSVVARVQLLESSPLRARRRPGPRLSRGPLRRRGWVLPAVAMLGLSGPRGALLANFAYGQDGEGDDHEGDLRAAALLRVGSAAHLGLDGRLRKSLDSTNPHRVAHGTPSLEFQVGPAATLGLGPIALTVEGGVSAARVVQLETGGFALAAVGAAF